MTHWHNLVANSLLCIILCTDLIKKSLFFFFFLSRNSHTKQEKKLVWKVVARFTPLPPPPIPSFTVLHTESKLFSENKAWGTRLQCSYMYITGTQCKHAPIYTAILSTSGCHGALPTHITHKNIANTWLSYTDIWEGTHLKFRGVNQQSLLPNV